MQRKEGISVLISVQNEERIVGLCIESFLTFGDEIVVVDNGSTDKSKDIARNMAEIHPDKVRFFDKPELPDLYHNRQFAFEQSQYQWIFRCDSDYVAFTDGKYDIMNFRQWLLTRKGTIIPEAVSVPQFNLVGDFFHTGIDEPDGLRGRKTHDLGYYYPPLSAPMIRFYRAFPLMKFKRRGRWEGVRFQHVLRKIAYPEPVWVQCSIKDKMNFFFRSERTNWRELGDYKRFPTLRSYIESIVEKKYGTSNLEEASDKYMDKYLYPNLQTFDPERHFPYPQIIRKHLKKQGKMVSPLPGSSA